MSRRASASEHRDARETTKTRDIRFNATPADQAARAVQLLAGLEGLNVRATATPQAVTVRYDIAHFTLRGLEGALIAHGFHLDGSLYSKLLRALVHYCEDTQLRNLRSPQRLLKKSHEIYVKAYEHHPHGDHDEMPPELREYK